MLLNNVETLLPFCMICATRLASAAAYGDEWQGMNALFRRAQEFEKTLNSDNQTWLSTVFLLNFLSAVGVAVNNHLVNSLTPPHGDAGYRHQWSNTLRRLVYPRRTILSRSYRYHTRNMTISSLRKT